MNFFQTTTTAGTVETFAGEDFSGGDSSSGGGDEGSSSEAGSKLVLKKQEEDEDKAGVVVLEAESDLDGEEVPSSLFDSCTEVGAWPVR